MAITAFLVGAVHFVAAIMIGVFFKNRRSLQSLPTRGGTIHWAKWYDPFVAIMSLGRSKKLRQMTVDLAQINASDMVLDVGCGTGQLTALIDQQVQANGRIVGIDPAAEMIATAQKKYPHVNFRLAAVEQLPFEDNTFDIVVSSLVLHHLPDDLKPESMAEIERVLKPGGTAVHVDFTHDKMAAVKQLAEHTGFEGINIAQTTFRPLWVIRMKKHT